MADQSRKPDVLLSHESTIPDELLRPLVEIISAPRLSLTVEEREPDGPYAALEWLIPTAVVLFLAKSYFGAFLQEAGKDHYHLLKKGLNSVWLSFFGNDRLVRRTLVASTPGKLSSERRYSSTFSLVAEADSQRNFKLLLPDAATTEELDAAASSFLRFVSQFHSGGLDEVSKRDLDNTRPIGRLVLLTYDQDSERLRVVDPMEGHTETHRA